MNTNPCDLYSFVQSRPLKIKKLSLLQDSFINLIITLFFIIYVSQMIQVSFLPQNLKKSANQNRKKNRRNKIHHFEFRDMQHI